MLFLKRLIKMYKSGLGLGSGLLVSLFLMQPVVAQETIWLSNTPPESMQKMVKTSGMHRLSAIDSKKLRGKPDNGNKKKEDQYKKIKTDSTQKGRPQTTAKGGKKSYRPSTKYLQWIRKGNSIQNAKYICLDDETDYELTLMSPEGNKEKIEIVTDSICYAKFELNEEGYYNTYLTIKKAVGDTLHVSIAKAELLNHSCRNGHHKRLEARPVRTYPEVTDFEMIRNRNPHEDYHYFTSSGSEEVFKVIYDGKPRSGVKVTLNTEKGWSKTFFTDENGEINAQFIQDYFSKWQELNSREIYYYMLKADYTTEKDIHFKGKDYSYVHYTLTMSDGYHPARTMYASMVWGLIVFLIALIASVAGIFIYKERRKRPYKEIKFNESNK